MKNYQLSSTAIYNMVFISTITLLICIFARSLGPYYCGLLPIALLATAYAWQLTLIYKRYFSHNNKIALHAINFEDANGPEKFIFQRSCKSAGIPYENIIMGSFGFGKIIFQTQYPNEVIIIYAFGIREKEKMIRNAFENVSDSNTTHKSTTPIMGERLNQE